MDEKLLAAGYRYCEGAFRNQVGPLILRWWGKWTIDVFIATPSGNEHILTFTFYGFEDRTVAEIEQSILEFYKTLHGTLPGKEQDIE